MSSLAQEESRSISENVTWGKRKNFSEGKVSMPYGMFLGYRKGIDGQPEIVPKEAETVKLIYRMFIEGKSVNFIANHLTRSGIPTPGGKQKWQYCVVKSILTNEKYKGDARLQKRFTVDFLSKKMKVNEGEVTQYYVKGSHPAIITPDEWEKVQIEMKRRNSDSKLQICNSPFSNKIICGDCGQTYGSKVWHSTDKYRRVIWQCNAKFSGNKKCQTPHLAEEQIKEYYTLALSRLLSNREALLEDIRFVKEKLTDCSETDLQLADLEQKIKAVETVIQKCIDDNASKARDQKKYEKEIERHLAQYKKINFKKSSLEKELEARQQKAEIFSQFLFEIKEIDLLDVAFREDRWNTIIDHVTVYSDEHLIFVFKNGSEITIEM